MGTFKDPKNTGDQPAKFAPRLGLLKAAAPIRTLNKPPFLQDNNSEDEFDPADHTHSNEVDHVRVLEEEEEEDSSQSWFPSDDEE